ncbi:PfkB family carbohydrate kinase [Intrasporangium calvum]|uniref:PfkB domain protein n=1 Tax=Intrasporangium calvum (strain ATCC 23552 / DSM 43043 / JCM 3097 / NBRC 12989 / NCIMB 10167 / NRRL B-3866 / 7 KIP) TaxID=710696 RepID=E6S921_INTC7|nr:PfkB family carbohydrate kinase [Intrasporangium calvum]ADU49196.1 PfkB domain protein [Intrasporangium calvum DSM 43043]
MPAPSSAAGPRARTLVIGEALIDAVTRATGAGEEHVGGSPANVAIGLAALEHPVSLATWIATDDHGNRIADHCRERKVDLTPGSQGAPFTSVAHATLDEQGAATYRFDLEWQLPAVPGLPDYGHVHTGSIAAVLEPGGSAVRDTLRVARSTATISYDPNARPTLMGDPVLARSLIEECVALADVVKVSDEDIAWLRPDESVEDVVADWCAQGAALVVVTRGGQGATATLSRTGETHTTSVPPVTVVDTVGAGDSFMAGLVSGLLDAGLAGGPEARNRLRRADIGDVVPALERAVATSRLTVAHPGAHAPTRTDLAGG